MKKTAPNLKMVYDNAIGDCLAREGLRHISTGLYLESAGDVFWRGLWVSFHSRNGAVGLNASLVIFCPNAFDIAKKCIPYSPSIRMNSEFSEFGQPIFTTILYNSIRNTYKEDRYSFSYNVVDADEVREKSELIYSDYTKVRSIIGSIVSYENLLSLISNEYLSTSRDIFKISLSYLIDPDLARQEVSALSNLNINKMTKEFMHCFKDKYL